MQEALQDWSGGWRDLLLYLLFAKIYPLKKTLDNCASLAFHFLLKANSSKRGSTEKECSFKIKQLN